MKTLNPKPSQPMVRLSSKAGGYLPNIGILLLHENFHLIMMNIDKFFHYNGNFHPFCFYVLLDELAPT